MAPGCDGHHTREVNGRVTPGRRHHLLHRAGSEGLPAVAVVIEAITGSHTYPSGATGE